MVNMTTSAGLIGVVLLARHGDRACRHPGHKTALEAAIERGYSSVAKLLLQFDVLFPLNILIFTLRHHWTPPMIQLLLRKGADIHFTTPNGDTVLHLSIAEYVEETCCYLVKRFTDAGCDPAACNSKGKTALNAAMERVYVSVVEVLLDLNVPFPSDILLFTLRQRCTLERIKFLIDKDADVHSVASNGDTILHLAINEYYPERQCRYLVKSLIDAGCNPSICSSDGKTVLEVAVERGYTSIVELLLSCNVYLPSGILPTALRRRSYLQMIEFLISKGADVHSTTFHGETVLHLAIAEYVEGACYYLVKTFIDAGCDPTVCQSMDDKAVLEAAIERGYTSVVELLLQLDHVLVPPDMVLVALRRRCTPRMIQSLMHKVAYHRLTEYGMDWDGLLQLVHASYSGQYRQLIIEILDASRHAYRRCSSADEAWMSEDIEILPAEWMWCYVLHFLANRSALVFVSTDCIFERLRIEFIAY